MKEMVIELLLHFSWETEPGLSKKKTNFIGFDNEMIGMV